MEFRIADTFTGSLAHLTGEEQKAAKTTAFDLQLNRSQPGLQLHKLDKPRDPNFFSVRVSKDIRLIVHKSASSLLLCYVDHHDKAYQWAERRKLETHPKTGAAQFVEIRETVQEIVVPQYVQAQVEVPPKPRLFASMTDEQLLGYGVPEDWLNDVRQANEDTLLALADHLPSEAAEALLEIATGGTPEPAKPVEAGADPFAHPDAERRFRLAMVCLKLGREQEAAHWFQGVLWKDPNHLPTLNAISDYYRSKGNRKMADLYRRKAEKVSGRDISQAPESARK